MKRNLYYLPLSILKGEKGNSENENARKETVRPHEKGRRNPRTEGNNRKRCLRASKRREQQPVAPNLPQGLCHLSIVQLLCVHFRLVCDSLPFGVLLCGVLLRLSLSQPS